MVTVLKRGSTSQTIKKILEYIEEISPKKGLNASKYAGTVKIKEDGLSLQKRLRDEWE